MKNFVLLVLAIIFLNIFTGDDGECYKLSYAGVYPDYTIFSFEDGRFFAAYAQDNSNYKNIPPQTIQGVERVTLSNGKMLLEGTQEEKFFVGKGKVSFKVKQLR